ncbi:hypothetical protein F4819DRAFT_472702 [Hypoxylon fuscum]|nr:hypothetical protein F4819DRAFT_472702 [Hypoxylon fuscum]
MCVLTAYEEASLIVWRFRRVLLTWSIREGLTTNGTFRHVNVVVPKVEFPNDSFQPPLHHCTKFLRNIDRLLVECFPTFRGIVKEKIGSNYPIFKRLSLPRRQAFLDLVHERLLILEKGFKIPHPVVRDPRRKFLSDNDVPTDNDASQSQDIRVCTETENESLEDLIQKLIAGNKENASKQPEQPKQSELSSQPEPSESEPCESLSEYSQIQTILARIKLLMDKHQNPLDEKGEEASDKSQQSSSLPEQLGHKPSRPELPPHIRPKFLQPRGPRPRFRRQGKEQAQTTMAEDYKVLEGKVEVTPVTQLDECLVGMDAQINKLVAILTPGSR